ncbi:hypothetical protein [Adhaeribacter pallidiroseus]|uniref:Uncharacterized protein n=1 Tax=Adhaeribacter pallidiroseus TaxID=2072847 RepID=A0A369QCW7_9BACT|nr:hypothetical protein [Adhaeribacter pallidiroseus]RDC62741.1 hypothetical protein AHMF7616_01335 [Adhaeribacter pallidiroseus]
MNLSLSLFALPILLMGIYLLLNQWVIPMLTRRTTGTLLVRNSRDISVSLLTTVADFVRLGAFTYGVFALAVLVVRLLVGVSGRRYIEQVVNYSDYWHGALGEFNSLKWITLVAAIIALGILLYRYQKRNSEEKFIARLRQTAEDLDSGKLPYEPLSPTPEMLAVEKAINNLQLQIAKVQGQSENKLEAQQLDYIEKLQNEEERLRQVWFWYSVIQQMKPEEPTPYQHANLKEDVLTVLSSKGLFNVFSSLNNALSKTVAVLGCVALLTVEVHQATAYLGESLAQKALHDDLVLAQAAFEEIKKENLGEGQLTPEDNAYLDAFAADFEIDLASSLFNRAPSAADSNNFAMRSMAVRAELLQRYVHVSAERRPDNDFDVEETDSASLVPAEAVPEEVRTYSAQHTRNYLTFQRAFYHSWRGITTTTEASPFRKASKVTGSKVPRTATGRAFRREMVKVATSSRPLWERMKAKAAPLKASFFEPVPVKDLSKLFVVDFLGDYVNAQIKFDSGELEALVGELKGDVWKNVHDKVIYEHLNQLAKDSPYEETLRALRSRSMDQTFSTQKYARITETLKPHVSSTTLTEMANRPPTLKVTKPLPDQDAILTTLDNIHGGQRSVESLRPINTFDDFFPGQLGSETRTIAGRAASRFRSGSTIAGEAASIAGDAANILSTAAEASFKRARNYRILRGFSRIGGVLIGEDPENKNNPEVMFTNIMWEDRGDSIKLMLTSKGKDTITGNYSKNLVQQALAYAADGRPTTITMVSALKTAPLKIILHPALLNSQLGNQAIQLDRLVDSYQSARVAKARNHVQLAQMLYQTAYWQQSVAIRRNQTLMDKRESDYLAKLNKLLPQRWEVMDTVWQVLGTTSILNSDEFPFTAKPKFFDLNVVKLIDDHLQHKYFTYVEFRDHLIADLESQATNKTDLSPVDPVEFQVWSGVREQPYKLDRKLTFLQPSKSPSLDDILYPFQFMVQTAFTTPPMAFMDPQNQAELDSALTFHDQDPWQFPNLNKNNQIGVAVWAKMKWYDRQAFLQMKQFTLLQRIFRLAFDGQLGLDFPIEKLLDLQTDAYVKIPFERTPEWNAPENWNLLQHLRQLQQVLELRAIQDSTKDNSEND